MFGDLHAIQTQIIGAALQADDARGNLQDLQQLGNITGKELVLQCLRGGRYQRLASGAQGGNEVGKGLAHPRTGLCHQRFALLDSLPDCRGKPALLFAHPKSRQGLLQQAFGTKVVVYFRTDKWLTPVHSARAA